MSVGAAVRPRRGLRRWMHGEVTTAELLAECTSVGPGAVVSGVPYIVNDGRLDIGADLVLAAQPVRSHLIVSPGGELEIA